MNKAKKTLASIVAGATLLSSSGCMHYSLDKNPRAAEKVPPAIEFDLWKHYYQKRDFFKEGINYGRTNISDEKNYALVKVTLFPESKYASYNNREIVFDYYLSRSNGKRPVIVILPIMGGRDYPIESHFARYFAKKGYNVSLVHREQKMDKEVNALEDVDNLLKTTVADNRRVIDWLSSQRNTDTNKIEVFGISFGAIKGSLLLALEERVKAGVLGLGGGDLPYLLAHTTEKGLVKHGEKLLKKHNLTLQEGEEILRNTITYEPNEFAKYIDPREAMLVLARFDTVVPYQKGLDLRRNMGDPKTLVVPAGHYNSAVFIPHIKSHALRFFERRFKDEERKIEKLAERK